jgi:hypothetical protein
MSLPKQDGLKIKTNIYLHGEQMLSLRELSARTNIPVSRLIRRGVDLLIREHRKILTPAGR